MKAGESVVDTYVKRQNIHGVTGYVALPQLSQMATFQHSAQRRTKLRVRNAGVSIRVGTPRNSTVHSSVVT